MKPSELTEDFTLTGATYHGHSLKVYDDSYGKLYIHRDSMGISGIVRAQTWEDAYGICEDEFFPEADETIDGIRKEYNFTRRHAKIVRDTLTGTVREATFPDDYAGGVCFPTIEFIRWDTIETPAPDGEDVWPDNALFQEACGFRPNGPNASDTHKHGIYAKDLNGDSLERLTDTLAAELGIDLIGEPCE